MDAAFCLWAKKDVNDDDFFWLPLYIHLNDVMNTAGWLWDHWLSSGQRRYIVEQMECADRGLGEAVDGRRLVRFLGGIHDIGKATPAFQIQKGYFHSPELDSILIERLENIGFSGLAHLKLSSPGESHHALAGETIVYRLGAADDIGSIVGAHHGKPIDDVSQYLDQNAYNANYYQTDDMASPVFEKWGAVQKYFYQWALAESGIENTAKLPRISEPGQILLSGLVIMADWIASNENYFPLISIDEFEVDEERRFEEGMRKWYSNLPLEIASVPTCEELYRKRFGFSPSETQQKIFIEIEKIQNPGIVVIEAPMGSGKTEAALAAAEQIAQKTGRSGLFFGLPTQATSNGMFGRVVLWLKNLTDDLEGKASIRLSHGSAALNEVMNDLARHVNEDGDAKENVTVNQWFSGRKKTALDDFVVGTVDQFLLTALKQKHLALRHLGFSRKIVVIDEVHAYDAYMQQYLERAVQWMGAYEIPVVLLSATLPPAKRISLIRSYLKGRGVKNRDFDTKKSVLDSEAYPLLSFSDGNEVKTCENFPDTSQKKIRIKSLDEAVLMTTLGDLIRDGGVVGVVVNTVKRAQKIARACAEHFGKQKIELLHSAYIATDRSRKESELVREIGKNGVRPDQKIIIGTQVIEQSLDIDFDVMISDICPIDLLLQRIGRLQRHEKTKRPYGHSEPVLYVLGQSDDLEYESGARNVYGDYLLIRSQYFLPDVITVPGDIPKLVRAVYSDQELELTERLRDKYETAKNYYEKYRSKEEEKARKFRIGSPVLKPGSSMIG